MGCGQQPEVLHVINPPYRTIRSPSPPPLTSSPPDFVQSQPLTKEQLATLTALVKEVASKTETTTQKVWSRLKKRLNVRAKQDIQQKDFDGARGLLLEELK